MLWRDASAPSHARWLSCSAPPRWAGAGEQLGEPGGHPFTEVPDTLFTHSLSPASGWGIIPRSGSSAVSVLGGYKPPFSGSAWG